ncbi:hypothetical protein BDW22DRAFT_1355074 [Trametopsis cervina]|nr:hypothetical protein BDW22DRAFT_1355074 [Trametopsis cervina]
MYLHRFCRDPRHAHKLLCSSVHTRMPTHVQCVAIWTRIGIVSMRAEPAQTGVDGPAEGVQTGVVGSAENIEAAKEATERSGKSTCTRTITTMRTAGPIVGDVQVRFAGTIVVNVSAQRACIGDPLTVCAVKATTPRTQSMYRSNVAISQNPTHVISTPVNRTVSSTSG